MTTAEGIAYLWKSRWAVGIAFFPAVFVFLCCIPEYLSWPDAKRRRTLKLLLALSILLALFPGLFGLLWGKNFWEASLSPGAYSRGAGGFIFGLIGLFLSVALALIELGRSSRRKPSGVSKMTSGHWPRFFFLMGCLGAGATIGTLGWNFTGGMWWFLAVPACIAAGWLFVANPAECESPRERAPGD